MRIIVGISGASCSILGIATIKALKAQGVETHLVISKGAQKTIESETSYSVQDVEAMADYHYDDANLGALISSGSFKTSGMIVAPCSMKSASAIAHAYDANLLVRAADVCLKENRRVVLIPREMPLNTAQIKNLLECSQNGCSIIPPMLTFYNKPTSIEDQITHIVGKALMQFDLDVDGFKPWDGNL